MLDKIPKGLTKSAHITCLTIVYGVVPCRVASGVSHAWHSSWQSMDAHAQVMGMLWFKAMWTRWHGGLGLSREEGMAPL